MALALGTGFEVAIGETEAVVTASAGGGASPPQAASNEADMTTPNGVMERTRRELRSSMRSICLYFIGLS